MMLHKSGEIKKTALSCLIVCLGISSPAYAVKAADAPAPNSAGKGAASPGASAAHASAPNANSARSDAAVDKELTVLENRFFFHHYGHDPVEKRLERIELLTLGETQAGSTAARLDNLKKAVIAKDSHAAKVMREQSKAQSDPGSGGKPASYPQVATLEWKILKKTYNQESLDQRLNRLETNVFGVPATAMSYLDRIERLKRTAGVDVAVAPSDMGVRTPGKGSPKFGPLPKAYAGNGNGMMPFGGGMPFFQTPPSGGGGAKPFVQEGTDGLGGHYRTYRDGNSFGWSYSTSNLPMPHTLPGQSPRAMADVFDDMNRQMNDMMKQFNGVDEMPFPISPFGNGGGFGGDFGGNFGISPYGQNGGVPGAGSGGAGSGNGGAGKSPRSVVPRPYGKITPLAPKGQPRLFPGANPTPTEELPPYSDPNSI